MKQHPIIFSKPMVEAILAGRKRMTRRIIKPQPIIDHDSGYVFDGKHRRQFDIHSWLNPFTDAFSTWLPGDVLYVRENWQMAMWDFDDDEVLIRYEDGAEINFRLPITDDPSVYDKAHGWMVKEFEKLLSEEIIAPETEDESPIVFTGKEHPFSPSIHLPKWCSRIWLKVVSVKVEQLQSISAEDAVAEGIGSWTEERMKSRPTHYQLYYTEPGDDSTYASNPVDSFESLWKDINGPESWKENPWVWVIEFEVLSTEGLDQEELK